MSDLINIAEWIKRLRKPCGIVPSEQRKLADALESLTEQVEEQKIIIAEQYEDCADAVKDMDAAIKRCEAYDALVLKAMGSIKFRGGYDIAVRDAWEYMRTERKRIQEPTK